MQATSEPTSYQVLGSAAMFLHLSSATSLYVPPREAWVLAVYCLIHPTLTHTGSDLVEARAAIHSGPANPASMHAWFPQATC